MKRIILFILLGLILSYSASSQKKNRKFEKIIEKYDVATILEKKSGKPEEFWRQLSKRHEGLVSFTKALTRRKKTALKAQEDISMALALTEKGYSHLYVYTGDTIENYTNIVSEGVLGEDADSIHLHIAYGEAPNAFCTPRGDIYVYSSLLDSIGYNIEMLYGICAHEVAHYYLRHSARQKWAEKKHEKKNRIMAGIALGLGAVADAAGAYYAGYSGTTYNSNFPQYCRSIMYSESNDNHLYHFKYSREQEIEADIIACRFLEFVGIDPACFTRALNNLGIENDKYYSNWSEHPTISYRVSFLNYLTNKYPLCRKTD